MLLIVRSGRQVVNSFHGRRAVNRGDGNTAAKQGEKGQHTDTGGEQLLGEEVAAD